MSTDDVSSRIVMIDEWHVHLFGPATLSTRDENAARRRVDESLAKWLSEWPRDDLTVTVDK
jgi:hypothetical protein